jgi:hypothetical protein
VRSQSESASKAANLGLIASQVTSGDDAAAIAACASATNARTIAVSRTNSLSSSALRLTR